ncbi:unnamed protein product [Chrysodeixis includens]|uniref:Lipase domain-containing protein n=1 Tax=Chrysodeixis includens TaxID=689277 RepID=A0A9P0FS90_CHRIL|nr:unnamed protein product [Chrysodeixis includens]
MHLLIYFYLICTLTDVMVNGREHFSREGRFLRKILNDELEYGDGYGTKWINFPDDEGALHFINMTLDIEAPLSRNMLDNIEYRLYIWNHTGLYIMLNELAEPTDKSNLKLTSQILLSNLPLKVITHGWRSSADSAGVMSVKNAYLETKKSIVITVDWSITADNFLYPWVANETKAIGARIATFLDNLNYRYNISGKEMHLIGHSLGAHVMGNAGSRTKIRISRVTGLDPARPYFEYPPQEDSGKLDSTDAEFVDVIHTCAGLLGFQEPIGTADFYPNNGIAPQPGCDHILKFFEACSHSRSFFYFSESIKYPKSFPAHQCQSWIEFVENRCGQNGYMGESVNRNTTGKYFLRTNAFEPFGKLAA